ncbi:MAG: extracellular solute-binding protein [Deltaproteobacteria bacterium]|nr:extracellular solute-binding protein [Deltaproteobacteria bacterium]
MGFGITCLWFFFLLAWSFVNPQRVSGAPISTDPAVIEAAKKEGQVSWYFNWTLPSGKAVADKFQMHFPQIKVNLMRNAATALANRLVTEARARRREVDVMLISDPFWPTIMDAGLVQPYCSKESGAFRPEVKDGNCLWTLLNVNTHVIAYNTQLVKQEEAPRNLQDLLNPKWTGKLVMDQEDFRWFAMVLDKWGEEKGLKYMKALAAQKPGMRRGHTLILQLVAAGEFPVNVMAYGYAVEEMKLKGAPLDWTADEPVTIQGGVISLAKYAPHPNAAKLFIDYAMSKEGQEAIRECCNRVPTRVDVPPNPRRLIEGLKLYPLKMELGEKLNVRIEQFRSVFGTQ